MPISRKKWPECPIERTLSVLSGRWKARVLWQLLDQERRFGGLRDRLTGVSERMLTQVLSDLRDDGLVARVGENWWPTAAGLAMEPVLASLWAWGESAPLRPTQPPPAAATQSPSHAGEQP